MKVTVGAYLAQMDTPWCAESIKNCYAVTKNETIVMVNMQKSDVKILNANTFFFSKFFMRFSNIGELIFETNLVHSALRICSN